MAKKTLLFPSGAKLDEVSDAVLEVSEQIDDYARGAGDFASVADIERAQRVLARIARDAAQANLQLYQSLTAARNRADLAHLKGGQS